ncbi:MAG: hypothetical protein WDO73_34760 [Ignavibacteriota bacterium]
MGRASEAALYNAASLIAGAKTPVVLLGLMASKPKAAVAIRELLSHTPFPVVGTFQAAGAVSQQLFPRFGGRVGQLANQPADRLLSAADLVITIGYDPVEYWPSLWNQGRDRTIVHNRCHTGANRQRLHAGSGTHRRHRGDAGGHVAGSAR